MEAQEEEESEYQAITQLALIVVKLHVPMRPVAERLILRSATTAQSELLGRRAFAKLGIQDFRCARNDVGTAGRDENCRLSCLIGLRFNSGNREVKRPGRARLDDLPDLSRARAIRINPRLLPIPEHCRQPLRTLPRVCADSAIVVNRDVGPHVIVTLVGGKIPDLLR